MGGQQKGHAGLGVIGGNLRHVQWGNAWTAKFAKHFGSCGSHQNLVTKYKYGINMYYFMEFSIIS